MEFRYLLVEEKPPVCWVRFNRPPVNALNTGMVLEIERLFDELGTKPEITVVILTGQGKAFIAGADIAEMSSFSALAARQFAQQGHRCLDKIAGIEKVVIAAINGFALGGGCELALACDLRIMAEGAKIGQPEVNLGLIPGFGGTQRLARLVGPGIAKEMIFTGEPVDAAEAWRIGLVNRVVKPEELLSVTGEIAERIASRGPAAVRLAKACINHGLDTDLQTGCAFEIEAFGVCFASGEPAEGTRAFLEKRNPDWKKGKE
ncbi:MAG: enoyl-CoA hydratase-related protein [candidate division WOR-3 bacterium]|uniref:Crotonase n=2 Tax=candidate division WOR-3 bacterium TaxID=2052148 RepID=A0A7C3EMV2_UNCW3|nr:enoyl-CoA hydratase-related protein [candidate division WOR-3 bacterium]